MADVTAATWDQTDADNDAASPEGAPEGMAPGGVNNTIRMIMGAVKRAYVWSEVPTVTAGTSTAYSMSYDVAPAELVDGMSHVVLFNATCGASPTLNINSLGAKPLHYYTGTAWDAVPAGLIKSNMVCTVSYRANAGTYRILSFPVAVGTAGLAADNAFTGANTFSGTLTMSGKAINEAARVDVASATTCDIGAAASNYVRITGTTTITGLGTIAGARRHVVFAGILILTHNATSLILPNAGSNITTAAGDCALFESEGSGNWRCLDYQRADGKPLAVATSSLAATGYRKESDGFIRNWGISALIGPGGSGLQTFALPFPTACLNVLITPLSAGATDNNSYPHTITDTDFEIFSGSAGGGGSGIQFYWQAIGH